MSDTEIVASGQDAEVVEGQPAKVAPAADAKPEGEEGAEKKLETKPEPTSEEKKRNREAAERRIEKKRLRDLEIENARLRGIQEGLGLAKKEPEPAAKPIEKPVRPKEADFSTTAEFEQAMDKYEDDRDAWKESLKAKDSEKIELARAAEVSQKTLNETVLAQIAAGQKQYEDFDEVVLQNDELVTTPLLVKAIAKRANGHDIQYWLGKNVEESKRLALIKDPIELAAEVGEISANLKASQKQKTPASQVTKAPQPAATVAAKTKVLPADTMLAGKTQADRIRLLEEAAMKRRKNGDWQRA